MLPPSYLHVYSFSVTGFYSVLKVYAEPKDQFNDDGILVGCAYADIEWDDVYGITIHKAQGSQWSTVIIPIYQSRNMDRSMLYMAMTRATKKWSYSNRKADC